jgi:anthranilate synthase component 2
MGQQAIVEEHPLDKVYHGVPTMVKTVVDDELLFEGLGNEVGRYHSWS